MMFSAHDSVRRAAMRISLIYLIAGFAWIFFSDESLDTPYLTRISSSASRP